MGGKALALRFVLLSGRKHFPLVNLRWNRHKRDTLLSVTPGVPSPVCSFFIFLYSTFFVRRRPPFCIT